MNENIKNYIFENYDCNKFILLNNGTCILINDDIEISDNFGFVKNILNNFKNGQADYKTNKDKYNNLITTYNIPNVINIVFKDDIYKTNEFELQKIQGRNNLIKDVYDTKIIEIFQRECL